MQKTAKKSLKEFAYEVGFVVGLLVFLSGVSTPIITTAENAHRHRYIIGFKKDALEKQLKRMAFVGTPGSDVIESIQNDILEEHNLQAKLNLPGPNAAVVEVTDAEVNELMQSSANESSAIEYVEADQPLEALRTPNDNVYARGLLWGLNNPNGPDINAPEAWDTSVGSQNVIVGVIDTGIDYTHPDLVSNMWRNNLEVAGNGIDDDGNGYVDDIYGADFVNNDGDPWDDHYHGTHVAGTIGGSGDNEVGVAGVNWSVKLMGLKFLDASGSGWTSGAVAAVYYAIQLKQRGENIRVLNASFGGGGYSRAMRDALVEADAAGIMFVAAAGNSALDNDVNNVYPANYEVPNIISVAAVTSSGGLASFSDYGATKVHLGAPGQSIASTIPSALGSYAYLSGTSMAAPHVSGVAALVLSVNPSLAPSALRDLLMSSSQSLASLSGKTVSGGMVNAQAALIAAGGQVQRYSITGTVSLNGTALAGVAVDGGALGVQTTDANGNYQFGQLDLGTAYNLVASKSGFVFSAGAQSGTVLNNAQHHFKAAVATYELKGRVVVDGKGLKRVTVNAGKLGKVTTDSNGNFAIGTFKTGIQYTIKVSKDGFTFLPAKQSGTLLADGSVNFTALAHGKSSNKSKGKRKKKR